MSRFKICSGLLALTSLAACGGAMYRPAASNFAKSLEAVNQASTEGFKDYPNEARTAYVRKNLAAAQSLNGGSVLCIPIYRRTLTSAMLREVQLTSAGLTTLSGDSPNGFANLVAATAGSYSVLPPTETEPSTADRFKAQALKAHESCQADVKPDALETAAGFFVPGTNPQAGDEAALAAVGAIISLWQIFEPIAEGGLRFIDQQRREKAIRAFIRSNGAHILSDIQGVGDFFLARNSYLRALAARQYVAAFTAAKADGTFSEDEFSSLSDKANVYDALADQSMKPAFDDLEGSLQRLIKVANGQPSGEDLAAAIKGFGSAASSFAKVANDIDALAGEGEENKKLKDAIKKLKESLG